MAGTESSDQLSRDADGKIPVISLAAAPGARETWTKSPALIFAWAAAEMIFVTNPWQISSRLRVRVLRAFGAQIGDGVTMRPRIRVKFPWNLRIGRDSWIGEGVWFHNQARITVGSDVVISQETMLTTGSHAHRRDMALLTAEILVEDGVWVTSRCMVLGGVTIGRSALIGPMTVVKESVASNTVVVSSGVEVKGTRFPVA